MNKGQQSTVLKTKKPGNNLVQAGSLFSITFFKLIAVLLSSLLISACSLDATISDLAQEFLGTVTVEITAPEKTNAQNSGSIPIQLDFSASCVEVISESDLQITGGTIVPGSLSGSAKQYTLNITPDLSGELEGVIQINFPSKDVTIVGNYANLKKTVASASATVVVDKKYPTATLATEVLSPTAVSLFPLTLTFNELVTGLTVSDFEILETGLGAGVGGASITSLSCADPALTTGCQVYNLNLTAGTSAEIKVTLKPNSVTDLAGNPNYASTLDVVYDTNIPQPSLSTIAVDPTNLNPIPITINFNGTNVTGLELSDFVVTDGTISDLAGSGSSYTLNFIPTIDSGIVTIRLAQGTVVNALGTANAQSNRLNILVDYILPSLSINGPSPAQGHSASTFEWIVSYSDFTTISLAASHINVNTVGVSCSAPVVFAGETADTRKVRVTGCTGNGSFYLSVAAGTAADAAGNLAPAIATSSSVSVDNTAPTLAITGPSLADGNSTKSFTWTLTYSGYSEITLSDADISIEGTDSAGTCSSKVVTGAGNLRNVTLAGCSDDGTVKINVAAGTAKDNVGNLVAANTTANTANVDNTAPTISIGSVDPSNGNSSTPFEWVVSYTGADAITLNNSHISLTGLTSTAGCNISVVNPVGQSQRTVRVTGCNENGSFGISIAQGTGTDVAGNATAAASSSSQATINSSAFTATLASVSSPVNNLNSIPVTVSFSGATSDFTSSDLTLSNATITGFTGSGANYSFNLIPSITDGNEGEVKVSLSAGVAQNTYGVTNTASNELSFTVDKIRPTLSLSTPTPTIGNGSTEFVWTVTYTGVETASRITLAEDDITLGGTATTGCLKEVTGTGNTTRTITVKNCTGNGLLNITLAANTARDDAGNGTEASAISASVTVDNNLPTLAVTGPVVSAGNSSASFAWTLTYAGYDDDANITLAAADISIVGTGSAGTCSVMAVSSSGNPRTVTLSGCTGDGTVKINIAAGTGKDNAGNLVSAHTTSTAATVDNTAPTLTISSPAPASGNSSTKFVWNVTYAGVASVSDITLAPADITLGGSAIAGCVVSITGSGLTERQVEVTNCSGDGAINIQLAAGTAKDVVGNIAAASSVSGNATVDNTPPAIIIAGPTPTIGKSSTNFVWTVNYTEATTVNLSEATKGTYLTLTGTGNAGCSAVVSGSGTSSRTVTVSGCTANSGTVGFSLAQGTAQDTYGNLTAAISAGSNATIDNQAPTITISEPNYLYGNATRSFEWDVTYVGADTITLAATNVNLTGATTNCVKTIENTGTSTRKIKVTGCTGNGVLNMSIAANTAQDAVGNSSASATATAVTIDNAAPTLSIAVPTSNRINASGTTSYALTYTNADEITLSSDDITLTAAAGITCDKTVNIYGSSSATIVLSNCTGNGTITRLDIAAGSAKDNAGNLAATVNRTSTVTIDNTAPNIPTVALLVPASNAGGTPTPQLRLTGIVSGDVLGLYTDSSCSAQVAAGTASTTSLNLTTSSLAEGSYNFYVRSSDDLGNSTACANTGVSYTYAACTGSQRLVENTCANPIIVTLGETTKDPKIYIAASAPFAVELESNTAGVITQATQGSSSSVTLSMYPTGNPGVIVSLWPSKINLNAVRFCGSSSDGSIKVLNSMGSYKFGSGYNMFAYCGEFTTISNVAELSNALSGATDFGGMFLNATIFNQNLAGLDTSNVTHMSSMFSGASAYNQALPTSFNTSNVTHMYRMFYGASAYNQALPSSFDTSNVTNMYGMFSGASAYNQALPSSFNTSNVTTMSFMFYGASSYNQALPSSFNTSNVTDMSSMFYGASAYNQALPSSFDTSKVTNMENMFRGASAYNQALPSSFDTSKVTNMENMFRGASAYNQALPSSFDTSNVTKMGSMFSGASAYNQALPSSFDTSKVTNMSSMFYGASSYNQALPTSFDTSNVTEMSSMFYGASSYNQALPSSFDTSKVTNMGSMFFGASAYNQALPSSFDTSNVTIMTGMFYGASAYNQALPSSFNTSKVTNMSLMFSGASSYNQALPSSFDTSNVTNMSYMFFGASAYNQALPSSFNTSKVTNMSSMFNGASSYNQNLKSILNVCAVTSYSNFAPGTPISGTNYVPAFGDSSQCNKGGVP